MAKVKITAEDIDFTQDFKAIKKNLARLNKSDLIEMVGHFMAEDAESDVQVQEANSSSWFLTSMLVVEALVIVFLVLHIKGLAF